MSLDMQVQLRRNVDEMHAQSADLTSWVTEMNRKERSMRTGRDDGRSAARAEAEALARQEEEEEEREIAAAKEELRRLATEEEQHDVAPAPTGAGASAAPPKKGSTKYDKWDRYDAESAIKSLEEREADKERLRLEVARLENKRAQAQVRKKLEADTAAAEALRQAGNEAFGAARYEEATERYTSALDLTPRSAVLYANRALALLKLGAAAEAEEDCNASLMIEPAYVKARMRRAQARRSLFNYDGALEDIEAALEAEPRNAAARKQMQECRQLRGQKLAAAKAPATVQRTLEITQLAHDAANDANAFVAVVAPSAAAPAAQHSAAAAAVPTGSIASDGSAAAAPAAGASAASPVGASAAAAAAAARAAASSPGAATFGIPGSAADVERAWRSLRRQPAEWAAYARGLEPALVSSLFRHNLPSELLSAFIAAADAAADTDAAGAAHALAVLRALSGAGRFSILTMCMDKADAKGAASAFAKLEAARGRGELPDAEDLAALRAKYS